MGTYASPGAVATASWGQTTFCGEDKEGHKHGKVGIKCRLSALPPLRLPHGGCLRCGQDALPQVLSQMHRVWKKTRHEELERARKVALLLLLLPGSPCGGKVRQEGDSETGDRVRVQETRGGGAGHKEGHGRESQSGRRGQTEGWHPDVR